MSDDETLVLEPCDLFFTQGDAWLSRAIRLLQKPFWKSGERPQVNHVGGVVTSGTLELVEVIEALRKVVRHSLVGQYGPDSDAPGTRVEIWRPLNLTVEQKALILKRATSYEGDVYGWTKIALHVLDYPFDKTPVFRRLGRIDLLPFCSFVWARSFGEAELHFGVEDYAAQPDDMREFCRQNPDKYELIRELKPLG